MAQYSYRLPPWITDALIVLRDGENQLRDLENQNNQTTEEIQSRQLWLNNNPLDHPDRVQVENDLANLLQSLTHVCNVHEMFRQEVNLVRYDLYNWVMHSSNLWPNFPFSFYCKTVEEIDAVHTLKNRIAFWPGGCVFRVAIRTGTFYRVLPPVPFQVLNDHAQTLNLEVVSLHF